MISERMLKQWRKEALNTLKTFDPELYKGVAFAVAEAYQKSLKRTL